MSNDNSYSRKRSIQGVPIGIEKVLFEAAGDSTFRKALLTDREGALIAHGFQLRDSEQAMLMAIPTEQLSAAIDGMDTSPTNVQRRRFMQVVAASAMTVSAAESVSCSFADDGSRPDMPEDAMIDAPAATGVRPDLPDAMEDGPDAASDGPSDGEAHDVDLPVGPDSAGIRPDGWEDQ